MSTKISDTLRALAFKWDAGYAPANMVEDLFQKYLQLIPTAISTTVLSTVHVNKLKYFCNAALPITACALYTKENVKNADSHAFSYELVRHLCVCTNRNLPPIARQAQLKKLRDALQCTFGNPYDPLNLDPMLFTDEIADRNCRLITDGILRPAICLDRNLWLKVRKMTENISKNKSFQDMPILADALEDAGITNERLLNHCRSSNQHFECCHVLDYLLTMNFSDDSSNPAKRMYF